MQVMLFWKDEIGRSDDNLTHAPTNPRYGCHILRLYRDRQHQNLNRALAAYNGSSGSLRYLNKVHTAWEKHWRTENTIREVYKGTLEPTIIAPVRTPR